MRPKIFIVYVVQELVRQMGAKEIYGSGDIIQANRQKHFINLPWIHAINFKYDDIWTELGGKKRHDGWFELPLVAKRKTMDEIPSHKRAYYKRRYAQMDDISNQISKFISNESI